ncbi:hypothetical protein D3C78_1417740 [compost metagenome]
MQAQCAGNAVADAQGVMGTLYALGQLHFARHQVRLVAGPGQGRGGKPQRLAGERDGQVIRPRLHHVAQRRNAEGPGHLRGNLPAEA